MTPKTAPAGKPGRPRKAPEERLISNGIHMHPSYKRGLVEVVAFLGITQREFIEGNIDDARGRIARRPLYREWKEAGRPIPMQEWIDAGKPRRWKGKFLSDA